MSLTGSSIVLIYRAFDLGQAACDLLLQPGAAVRAEVEAADSTVRASSPEADLVEIVLHPRSELVATSARSGRRGSPTDGECEELGTSAWPACARNRGRDRDHDRRRR